MQLHPFSKNILFYDILFLMLFIYLIYAILFILFQYDILLNLNIITSEHDLLNVQLT